MPPRPKPPVHPVGPLVLTCTCGSKAEGRVGREIVPDKGCFLSGTFEHLFDLGSSKAPCPARVQARPGPRPLRQPGTCRFLVLFVQPRLSATCSCPELHISIPSVLFVFLWPSSVLAALPPLLPRGAAIFPLCCCCPSKQVFDPKTGSPSLGCSSSSPPRLWLKESPGLPPALEAQSGSCRFQHWSWESFVGDRGNEVNQAHQENRGTHVRPCLPTSLSPSVGQSPLLCVFLCPWTVGMAGNCPHPFLQAQLHPTGCM